MCAGSAARVPHSRHASLLGSLASALPRAFSAWQYASGRSCGGLSAVTTDKARVLCAEQRPLDSPAFGYVLRGEPARGREHDQVDRDREITSICVWRTVRMATRGCADRVTSPWLVMVGRADVDLAQAASMQAPQRAQFAVRSERRRSMPSGGTSP